MTYDELADGIASKRWTAPKQIRMDVEILRRSVVRPSVGERRFFGAVGIFVMAYAELSDSMMALSIGCALLAVAMIGVLHQRRLDRVAAWFDEVAH
jgi:cell division protein FtsW (lipid II flippase)